MDNLEKDKIDTLNLEDLNTSKQIESLEAVFAQVSKIIYDEHKDEVSRGNLEIVDIFYTKDNDNRVVYTAVLQDKDGNKSNVHFSKDLKHIDISDEQIQKLKLVNADTTELEEEKSYLESLSQNPDKISLSNLKSLDKEAEKTCSDLGISKEELSYVAVIDKDEHIKVDPNAIKGLHSETIDANEKISTFYTLKDVIGKDYAKYQIINTTSGTPLLLGITEDGYAEEIDSSSVELLSGVNTMSLMQENGTTKEVSVLAAFRIKSQSDVDRDQVIGLCNDNTSEMTAFYARGAITADRMIGENIPARVYYENRVEQEKIMDTMTNKDISGEAKSAQARTDNGAVIDTSNTGDIHELVQEYSVVYGIEPEILEDEATEALANPDNHDKTDEEIVEETAIDLSEENDKSEQDNDAPEHVMGTPWGNPNNH